MASPSSDGPTLILSAGRAAPPVLSRVLREAGHEPVAVDVGDGAPATVDRLLRDAVETRPPAVLVNLLTAGTRPAAPEDLELDAWNAQLTAQVTRSLRSAQLVGRVMRRRGSGVIVTVLAGRPEDAISAITDRAVVGLMRVLGVEWGPAGVRVVTVAPEGDPGPERDAAVADAVAFLAGARASYVTASEVPVHCPAVPRAQEAA